MDIQIPINYIIDHFTLSWSDVDYGIKNHWLRINDIKMIAKKKIQESDDFLEIELATSKLTMWETQEYLEKLKKRENIEESKIKNNWLYIILNWLFDNKSDFDDPLGIVEQVYADFGYPKNIESFVRYMPAKDGYRPQDHSVEDNLMRLFKLWENYLAEYSPHKAG